MSIEDDKFSDFDPEDLEEITRLADAADALVVVDIEDYEPPHGLRLPAGSQIEHDLISSQTCTLSSLRWRLLTLTSD